MSARIGWKFPPTGGGQTDGWNHPGIGHFRGSQYESLARETIQNSMDAVLDSTQPVYVVFELIDLTSGDFGDPQFSETTSACLDSIQDDDDPARPALQIAEHVVKRGKVPCLRISDRNTTGLQGRHWKTLVKAQGHSYKMDPSGAGGSHGIGKYAPFAVSDLRTVFYWSCFEHDQKLQEKFQGKSILISHQKDGEETQGTGFYGVTQDCSEIVVDVPERFRLLSQGEPVRGTSLTIAGFRESAGVWRQKIADSILASFFYAIDNDKLSVILEPDEDQQNAEIEINKQTLNRWFQNRLSDQEGNNGREGDDLEGNPVWKAYKYWETSRFGQLVETQDPDLGHCRLWIRVDDDETLPRGVALVRRTGMLITDRQRKLERFPSHRSFAALCVFEDPLGNDLLRRMETEKHDQFEPDRLPVADRKRGHRALQRIVTWIRTEIRKAAVPCKEGRQTVLDDLAAYLPLFDDQEDVFDSGAGEDHQADKEQGLGERVTVKLKPVRRSVQPSLSTETPEGDESGDGWDTGNEGGGGTCGPGGGGGDGGAGEGDGAGGTGGGGGGTRQYSIPVSRVRILPIRERENCYRVSFAIDFDGIVRLTLEEAGDFTATPRSDVKAMDGASSLERVSVARTRRNVIEITADQPVTDRAWRLSAVTASEGS